MERGGVKYAQLVHHDGTISLVVTVDTAGSGHKAAELESGSSQLTRVGQLDEEAQVGVELMEAKSEI